LWFNAELAMPGRNRHLTETISEIVHAHRTGAATPADTVARTFARIRAYNDPAVFISLRDEAEALAEAKALMAAGPEGRPLYGVPVGIKDNIDAAGCRAGHQT
jgi:allophanate hydrolase